MRQLLTTALYILSLIFAAPAASMAAQQEERLSGRLKWQPSVLPGAKSSSFHSRATGRTYRIQIGKVGREPAGGYPVVYVLDGDAIFPVAFLHGSALAMQPQDNAATSMLVVGVGYSETTLLDMAARAADYTPPAADYSNTGDAFAKHFGQADRFLDFLNDELKPAIANDFHIDKANQTLIGHSYGALFGLYALFSQPDSFSSYIVSSPSIWWNKSHILTYFEKFKQDQQQITTPIRIRITSGSLEQAPSSYAQSNDKRVQMLNSRQMVSNACAISASIDKLGNSNIHIEYQNYPNKTHGTVIMPAIADGITYSHRGSSSFAKGATTNVGCF